jgi:hypothetical protein
MKPCLPGPYVVDGWPRYDVYDRDVIVTGGACTTDVKYDVIREYVTLEPLPGKVIVEYTTNGGAVTSEVTALGVI